jgi:hypothetical protein
MKKIVLLASILLAVNSSAMASCGSYSCVSPYDMNSKFRTTVSAVSGVNSITEKSVETILKKEAKKYIKADNLKIDIESYSSKDLKNGIFKSAYAKGENVEVGSNIHLTELELKTLCDFNYIRQANKSIVFVEDMPVSFNVKMTPEDINKTMQHPRYKQLIEDLNTLGANYGKGLKISSTKVAIQNNKFYYIVRFHVPFFGEEPKLVFQSDVSARNGQIKYNNTRVVSGTFSLDLSIANYIINYLNPLSFSIKVFGEKESDLYIDNFSIKDNMIVANGIITVKKD